LKFQFSIEEGEGVSLWT